MAVKQITLKVTAAFALDGAIQKPGSVVTVDEPVAKNLLYRGRCELHTADDVAEHDDDLSDLNVPELKELAEGLGIVGAANMKKAELIESIEAAQAG